MKKIFTLFVLAIFACLNAAAQFVPEDGKQYVIKDAASSYYIVLAVGNDSQASNDDNTTQASLGVVGTPFTFTASGAGFILSTDGGKFLGNSRSRAWNVDVTVDDTVWMVNSYEEATGRCKIERSYGVGLGLDNHTIGSGVYTDKGDQYWCIEEYVAPEETHTVTATLDGETVDMLEDGDGGYLVTFPNVESGDHVVVVSYDGDETTYAFTTTDFKVYEETVSVGKVTVVYKDGEISVSGDGIHAGPVNPETRYEGQVTVSLTSISSLDDLEGLQITFEGAQSVAFNENGYYGIGNEDGSEMYAIWAKNEDMGYDCNYSLDGNTVTLTDFAPGFDLIPEGTTVVYLIDYSAFVCDGLNVDEDNVPYFDDVEIAYTGAPATQTFDLVISNNGVECVNGVAVEASATGISATFSIANEGLEVANYSGIALYKDYSPVEDVNFIVTSTGITIDGLGDVITTPGAYMLVIPAGIYTNAEGATSKAFTAALSIIDLGTAISTSTVQNAREARIFDMQGRRVAAPAKGLYIQNGVKVVR